MQEEITIVGLTGRMESRGARSHDSELSGMRMWDSIKNFTRRGGLFLVVLRVLTK